MISWGIVTGILEETENIQFLLIELRENGGLVKAVHYLTRGNRHSPGDKVELNMSALDLELGTGGYAFVIPSFVAENSEVTEEYPGHIMKLRYTSLQRPVLACEAPESEWHHLFIEHFSLEGKRVFLGELHSMLPVLVSLLYNWDTTRKIVYIMDDQAALFVTFSDHLRYLQQKTGLVTITYGQAVGGDLETVNVYTALEAASKVVQADDLIITQGPGVVGTGTERGFSGMNLVHWLHSVHTCGGESLLIPRIQFGDRRARHYGLSRHTLDPLAHHALVPATIPYPLADSSDPKQLYLLTQLDALAKKHKLIPVLLSQFKEELEEALSWYAKPILTMGRSYVEDPYFFYAIGAAYYLYKRDNEIMTR